MKTRLLVIVAVLSFSANMNAQLKIATDGKVGVGTAISPTSQFELGNNQWIKLSAIDGKTGVLFHETGSLSATDVQYGAKIFYDEDNDRFSLVTRQDNVDNYGICIQRTYGRVGIAMTNPSYTLDVNGYVRATNVSVSSDLRLKTEIKDLNPNVTSFLFSLKAKTYKPLLREPSNFYTPANSSKSDTLSTIVRVDDPRNKTMIGYLAQDVQKLFPELISEDEGGYLSMDYMGLIPILVEALKEQKIRIDQLEKKVALLSQGKTGN